MTASVAEDLYFHTSVMSTVRTASSVRGSDRCLKPVLIKQRTSFLKSIQLRRLFLHVDHFLVDCDAVGSIVVEFSSDTVDEGLVVV